MFSQTDIFSEMDKTTVYVLYSGVRRKFPREGKVSSPLGEMPKARPI